jgi:hypothetical protein
LGVVTGFPDGLDDLFQGVFGFIPDQLYLMCAVVEISLNDTVCSLKQLLNRASTARTPQAFQ